MRYAAGGWLLVPLRDASGELLEKYSGTLYASMGALASAKYFFEKGDLKTARAQLQW